MTTNEPKRPIGSIVQLIEQFTYNEEQGYSRVPCDGCVKCCKAKGLYAEVTEEESKTLQYTLRDGKRALAKREDHSCVYLIDDKCSIYNNRPQACRIFDCRPWAVLRYVPSSDPDTKALAAQWDITPKTERDMAILMALRTASKLGLEAQNNGTGTYEEHVRRWQEHLPAAKWFLTHKRKQ